MWTHEPGQRVEVSQGLPSQRCFPAVPGSGDLVRADCAACVIDQRGGGFTSAASNPEPAADPAHSDLAERCEGLGSFSE